jgi:hypothetical protein
MNTLENKFNESYGFDFIVFKIDNRYIVESDRMIKKEFSSFDEFMDQMIYENPLWFTFYYVNFNSKFVPVVNEYLGLQVKEIFKWIEMSEIITSTPSWSGDEAHGGFGRMVSDQIRKEIETKIKKYQYQDEETERIAESKRQEKEDNIPTESKISPYIENVYVSVKLI